jgi:hypothetical protein
MTAYRFSIATRQKRQDSIAIEAIALPTFAAFFDGARL